jgi:hypothetical protein
MKSFFPQVENVSLAPHVSAEIYFRGEGATGLIEKHFDGEKSAVLLFVNGEPLNAFLLEDGLEKLISLAEFSDLHEKYIRIVPVPSVTGRLVFLALESQVEAQFEILDSPSWERQMSLWRQDGWSGLVEVKSNDLHGFVLFWQGEIQKSDLSFSTPDGFVHEFPSLSTIGNSPWKVTAYQHNDSTPSYRYTVLRQGAKHWSRGILTRYQEMVGQKFLQIMDHELNHQIEPWRWNICLAGMEMHDLHFFPYLSEAAHAYRALFMLMGSQMNFVIGNHLTQKLLGETYEQILPAERAALHAQRLIPAAFSE